MDDANDFLMGAGGRSWSWRIAGTKQDKPIGTEIRGIIVGRPEKRQQTDAVSKKPLTWDDGSPKWQLVVKLQTTDRSDSDDDGVRALYVKGKNLTDAVRDAVKAVGARGLETGGELAVALTGYGQPEGNLDPPREFAGQYRAPVVEVPAAAAPMVDARPYSTIAQPAGQWVPSLLAGQPAPVMTYGGVPAQQYAPPPTTAPAPIIGPPAMTIPPPPGIDSAFWSTLPVERQRATLAALAAAAGTPPY